MSYTLLCCVLLLTHAEEPTKPPRKASSIAPSLPALTKDEEKKIEAVIDRFILADTGKLRGADAREAVKDFDKLGPESIPALIRGLNQVATINHSCPVLMISKKLLGMLSVSNDQQLLDFARDEIGAGVGRAPHSRVLQDLRFRCLMRRNALANRPAIAPGGPAKMSTADLNRAIGMLPGRSLEGVLGELAKRDEKEALRGLAMAAVSRDSKKQSLGREGLDTLLGRESISGLQEKMTDMRPEVRMSAIRVSVKHEELVLSIIEKLTDENAAVRAQARQVLVTLAKDKDFGPQPTATKAQQREAESSWRQWWLKKAKQSK